MAKQTKPLAQCAASMGDGECVDKRCQSSVPGDRMFGTCPLPWGARDAEKRATRAGSK